MSARVKVSLAFQLNHEAAVVRRKKALSLQTTDSIQRIYETISGRSGGPALWPKDFGELLNNGQADARLFYNAAIGEDGPDLANPDWQPALADATVADFRRGTGEAGGAVDLLLRMVELTTTEPHEEEEEDGIQDDRGMYYSRTFLHFKEEDDDEKQLTPRAVSDPGSRHCATPMSRASSKSSLALDEQGEQEKIRRKECEEYIQKKLLPHLGQGKDKERQEGKSSLRGRPSWSPLRINDQSLSMQASGLLSSGFQPAGDQPAYLPSASKAAPFPAKREMDRVLVGRPVNSPRELWESSEPVEAQVRQTLEGTWSAIVQVDGPMQVKDGTPPQGSEDPPESGLPEQPMHAPQARDQPMHLQLHELPPPQQQQPPQQPPPPQPQYLQQQSPMHQPYYDQQQPQHQPSPWQQPPILQQLPGQLPPQPPPPFSQQQQPQQQPCAGQHSMGRLPTNLPMQPQSLQHHQQQHQQQPPSSYGLDGIPGAIEPYRGSRQQPGPAGQPLVPQHQQHLPQHLHSSYPSNSSGPMPPGLESQTQQQMQRQMHHQHLQSLQQQQQQPMLPQQQQQQQQHQMLQRALQQPMQLDRPMQQPGVRGQMPEDMAQILAQLNAQQGTQQLMPPQMQPPMQPSVQTSLQQAMPPYSQTQPMSGAGGGGYPQVPPPGGNQNQRGMCLFDDDDDDNGPMVSRPVGHMVSAATSKAEELFDVVSRNDLQALREMLTSQVDVNECTAKGSHVLFRAVIKARELDMIHMLLNAGADPRSTDEKGNQVMHFWARATVGRNYLLDMGRSLLLAGADVNAQRFNDGMSPLHHVVVGHNNRRGWLDFHKALMLVRHGANIYLRTHVGQLPLNLVNVDGRAATKKLVQLLQYGIPEGTNDWPCCEQPGCIWCS